MRANLGSLDSIKRVIKTLGMVNCTPDFTAHPLVINGYSELFAEVFGADHGVGARSAVGMNSLPSNMAVEIEVIFELNLFSGCRPGYQTRCTRSTATTGEHRVAASATRPFPAPALIRPSQRSVLTW